MFVHLVVLGLLLSPEGIADSVRLTDSLARTAALNRRTKLLDSLEAGETAGSDDLTATASYEDELADQAAYLAEHPYDLNRASVHDLEQIPYVTQSEAKGIADLRQMLGRFTSCEQLLLLDGDGESVLRKTVPFVTIGVGPRQAFDVRVRFVDDVSRSWSGGVSTDNSRLSTTHVRLNGWLSSQLNCGLLIERQNGGMTARLPVSGFLELRDIGILTHALVGDFALQTGNGIAFSSGRQMVASPAAGAPGGHSASFRGMAGRSRLFRGVAGRVSVLTGKSEIAVGLFAARFMVSSDIEAPAGEESDGSGGGLSADAWSAMAPATMGGFVEASLGSSLRFGTSFAYTPTSRVDEAGVSVTASLPHLIAFGEAITSGGENGLAGGVAIRTEAGAQLVMMARHYSASLASFGSPLCQFGDARNEKGVYIGWDCSPARSIRISGYLDLFARLNRTRNSQFPFRGRELLGECLLEPAHWCSVRLQWRERTSERLATGQTLAGLMEKAQDVFAHRRVSATGVLRLGRSFELATTVKHVYLDGSESDDGGGLLFSHCLTWRLPAHVKLALRVNSFLTDSYDDRVYAPEGNLPGMFSNAPLYGRGRMWYVRAEWKASPSIGVTVRYAGKESDTGSRGRSLDRSVGVQVDVKM
jgi:DNA uptake protein ComE-like DNA-binding protein